MAVFKGAGVALVTPMKDNGEINYEVLGALIEDQISKKTDAIIICGTSGEAPTLEDDEHLEAIRYTVDKTAGRIPVIAGTGSNNTAHAVMMSKEAQKLGADGCLLVAPYYNKATQTTTFPPGQDPTSCLRQRYAWPKKWIISSRSRRRRAISAR